MRKLKRSPYPNPPREGKPLPQPSPRGGRRYSTGEQVGANVQHKYGGDGAG